jgi:hypothetical protein
MSDTAQDPNPNVPNVKDIWSVPKPVGGSYGKPGLAGGGESGSWESDTAEQEPLSAEVLKSPEILVSPEVGEDLKPAKVYKPGEERAKESPNQQPEEPVVKGQIVDQRTGKKLKTHRVAEAADKVTQVADIEEQDFIENVEKVHSII